MTGPGPCSNCRPRREPGGRGRVNAGADRVRAGSGTACAPSTELPPRNPRNRARDPPDAGQEPARGSGENGETHGGRAAPAARGARVSEGRQRSGTRRGNPPAARKPPENVSGATAPPASPHTAASTPALQGPRQGCPPVPRSRPRPDGHSGRLGEPRGAQPPEAGGRRCSEPAPPGGVSVLPWASLAWAETAPGGRRRPPALEPRAARPALEAVGVCRAAVPSGAVYARARHHAVGTRPPRTRVQRAQPGDGQVH